MFINDKIITPKNMKKSIIIFIIFQHSSMIVFQIISESVLLWVLWKIVSVTVNKELQQ
jgi:hypothetical protein